MMPAVWEEEAWVETLMKRRWTEVPSPRKRLTVESQPKMLLSEV